MSRWKRNRKIGVIVIVVVIVIAVLAYCGVNFFTSTSITIIVALAGVIVSVITYIFQEKQLKQRGLIEVFKELNQPSHREARRISYGEKITDASYDLLGIKPGSEGSEVAKEQDLKRTCSQIFLGDINNAGTLIHHGLMDESIFLDEYWWIVLRCWDLNEDWINDRRNSGTGAQSYMRDVEELNDKAGKSAKKNFPEDFEEYVKRFRPKSDDFEKYVKERRKKTKT